MKEYVFSFHFCRLTARVCFVFRQINLGREDVRLVKMFFPAQLRALFLGLVLFSKVKGEYGKLLFITNLLTTD